MSYDDPPPPPPYRNDFFVQRDFRNRPSPSAPFLVKGRKGLLYPDFAVSSKLTFAASSSSIPSPFFCGLILVYGVAGRRDSFCHSNAYDGDGGNARAEAKPRSDGGASSLSSPVSSSSSFSFPCQQIRPPFLSLPSSSSSFSPFAHIFPLPRPLLFAERSRWGERERQGGMRFTQLKGGKASIGYLFVHCANTHSLSICNWPLNPSLVVSSN